MLTISLPPTWRCWMWSFGWRFHVPWPRITSRWTRSWGPVWCVLWMCSWLWDSRDWGMQTGGWWWRWQWWRWSMYSTMTAGLCNCWCLVRWSGHWLWGQIGWYMHFMRRWWCFTMTRWWLLGMTKMFSSCSHVYAPRKNILNSLPLGELGEGARLNFRCSLVSGLCFSPRRTFGAGAWAYFLNSGW